MTGTAQSLQDDRLSEAKQELDRINQTEGDYLGASGDSGWLAALHQADHDDRVTLSQANVDQYSAIDTGGSAFTSFAATLR